MEETKTAEWSLRCAFDEKEQQRNIVIVDNYGNDIVKISMSNMCDFVRAGIGMPAVKGAVVSIPLIATVKKS